MNLRQAAQQALEALEWVWGGEPLTGKELDAITALRAALAEPETEAETYKRLYELRGKALDRPCSNCGYQPERIYPMTVAEPEQEPVAWMQEIPVSGNEERSVRMTTVKMVADEWGNPIPLYTAPTPRKPQTTHWEGCEAVHPECKEKNT